MCVFNISDEQNLFKDIYATTLKYLIKTLRLSLLPKLDNIPHTWSEGFMGSTEDPNKNWYQGSKYDA